MNKQEIWEFIQAYVDLNEVEALPAEGESDKHYEERMLTLAKGRAFEAAGEFLASVG